MNAKDFADWTRNLGIAGAFLVVAILAFFRRWVHTDGEFKEALGREAKAQVDATFWRDRCLTLMDTGDRYGHLAERLVAEVKARP